MYETQFVGWSEPSWKKPICSPTNTHQVVDDLSSADSQLQRSRFCLKLLLQAVYNTLRARTAVFVLPDEGCMSLIEGNKA